ncbi:MAG: PhnD/SsuA/transferrin family substrate-binding protein [Pararhodobacter sp.]
MSPERRHASLPMYDWPEARDETGATWATIRDGVRARGLVMPEQLSIPDWAGIDAYWRDPALILSQCCWGPLSRGLVAHLRPLAQPDYSAFPGGRGPLYRSALVARQGAGIPVPDHAGFMLPEGLLAGKILAINERDSLSGCLGLWDDLGADPCLLATGCVETGSHRASIIALAQGRADIAAIDCRSWDLARRFEPCAAGLSVIGWTAERPGLPYVTSRATDDATVRALTETLISMGCHPVAAGEDE